MGNVTLHPAMRPVGPPPPVANWKDTLIWNASHSRPEKVLANAMRAFRNAPEFQGVLAFNSFMRATMLMKPPPWERGRGRWTPRPWTDNDDRMGAEWLQGHEIMVTHNVVAEAAEAVAVEQAFHPVKSYLESLAWDGVPRLDDWLSRYLGVLDSPYVRAVARRWLISAVARVYEPGCKADCMLILEGAQGVGKSTALRILAGEWFTDRVSDLSSKDAAQECNGVWLIEIGELDALGKSAISAIKAFLSRDVDRYRPAYGRRVVEFPRQCVFAGTVNPEGGYLKDPTGARRFWPVRCGSVDKEALQADRDQLWAEARDAYHRREPWWLDTPELEALAQAEQAERYHVDIWAERIDAYIKNRDEVSVSDILEEAIYLPANRWTQVEQNRVVRHLTNKGFKKVRARSGAARSYVYRRDPLA